MSKIKQLKEEITKIISHSWFKNDWVETNREIMDKIDELSGSLHPVIERRYFFKVSKYGKICKEECQIHKGEGIYIGSTLCKECGNCRGYGYDVEKNADWIDCMEIKKATIQ